MNRRALLEAIRVLKTIPQNRFNMHRFAVPTDCGTVGCIAGHCAQDPWFQERGFKLTEYRPYIPEHEHEVGRYAITNFFDLSTAQTNLIFYTDNYSTPTPQVAIKTIESLLAQ